TLTTAPQPDVAAQTFRVIHPFHPWCGRAFELVAYKNAWGDDRVYFYDEEERLVALPAAWTDVIAIDPFVLVASGRSLFQAADLLEMVALMHSLSGRGSNDV
ncbi:MAG: DUF5372 family protein, partial [Terracidiphilus sp.]